MEAALVKRVTIASKNTELSGAVGDDCICFCESQENFRTCLTKLIQSRELRNQIAENAWNSVSQHKITIYEYESFEDFIRNDIKR